MCRECQGYACAPIHCLCLHTAPYFSCPPLPNSCCSLFLMASSLVLPAYAASRSYIWHCHPYILQHLMLFTLVIFNVHNYVECPICCACFLDCHPHILIPLISNDMVLASNNYYITYHGMNCDKLANDKMWQAITNIVYKWSMKLCHNSMLHIYIESVYHIIICISHCRYQLQVA